VSTIRRVRAAADHSSPPSSRGMLHQIPDADDDDFDDIMAEEEVLENDFTLRAVLVGLIVGCVEGSCSEAQRAAS